MIALNEEFGIEKLRGVCDNATSRIYGFIMYTRKHSYIVKVLRDNDFWNELDEISGANWPIFSIKPLDDGYYARPRCSEEMCQMMVPIWKEPNSNRKLLDFFSLEESSDLPCFIIFIWKDNDEIEQIIWRLKNTNTQEAFDSIRSVVKIISSTEELILPEYKRSENVFRNVKENIEAVVFKQKLIHGARRLVSIKDFLNGLKV